MPKTKIAITIRSFDTNTEHFTKLGELFEISFLNRSGRRLDKVELIDAIRDCEGVIAGTERFDKDVLDSAPLLKVISRVGVGTDSIDVNLAHERKIRICNTPVAPSGAVAEHTVALILSLLKRIPQYNLNIRNGDMAVYPGEMIAGKIVGIIGLGRIGFRVASVLACFGAKIIFYDPFLTQKDRIPGEWTQATGLKSLMSEADIVTIHATPSKDNRPIIDRELLLSCKKGMVIINTARESCIDTDSLIAAAQSGIVGGIALDVFDNNDISTFMQATVDVIMTPHIASNTRQSRYEMELEAVNNLIHCLGDCTS
jgi:D-3-phosphoglycerate dehydrogenase